MKKLLVLTLVLGIASLASAALSLAATDNVVGAYSDDTEPYVAFIAYSESLDPAAVALTPAGDQNLSFLVDYGVNPGSAVGLPDAALHIWNFSAASSTVGALQPGEHLTATFADGTMFGDADMGLGTVYLLAEDTSKIGALYVVPEPATLALLGLGALVLRRKK